MSSMAFAAPVKDVATLRALAKEISSAKKAEYTESRKRVGVIKERLFLVETPMGPMVMIYDEAPNAGFVLSKRMASASAFDKYEMETVGKIAGGDPSKRPTGPTPHLAFEYVGNKKGANSTMIAAPVPDAAKFWQMCRDMSTRHQEHRESRERHGVTLERAFYLHDAKMAVVYMEGDDPTNAMKNAMTSTNAYDQWFVKTISEVHGIDFKAHAPPTPELLVSYDA
jgi:hypothetical protein